jgi:hypothetical protein
MSRSHHLAHASRIAVIIIAILVMKLSDSSSTTSNELYRNR